MKTAEMRANCCAVLIVATALLAGCNDRGESTSKRPPAGAGDGTSAGNPDIASHSFDLWLGQWNGPEGTFLILSKTDDHYRITIQSLDGPASYDGRGIGDHIEFERNGETETIRATNGQGTGMKWLREKTQCLTINPGEGFCRD